MTYVPEMSENGYFTKKGLRYPTFMIPYNQNSTPIRFYVDVYKTDNSGNVIEHVIKNPFDTLRDDGGTPEELKRISSDLYITDQFPPAYVMTAEGDFLRKQAPYMYGKLKEKNVFCELHEYSSPKEKLMHVFHLNMRSEDAFVQIVFARSVDDPRCIYQRTM